MIIIASVTIKRNCGFNDLFKWDCNDHNDDLCDHFYDSENTEDEFINKANKMYLYVWLN